MRSTGPAGRCRLHGLVGHEERRTAARRRGTCQLRRHQPELRLLATLYADLALLASSAVSRTAARPLKRRSTRTRDIFSRLGHAHTSQNERLVSLLAYAERAQLSLLMLRRIWNRGHLDPAAAEWPAIIAECFRAASRILSDIARLMSGGHASSDKESFAVLRKSA